MGTVSLKYFFVRALKGTDEGAVSATAAKQRIEQLIRAEEPAAPLTDEQICQALEGEDVAYPGVLLRNTVKPPEFQDMQSAVTKGDRDGI